MIWLRHDLSRMRDMIVQIAVGDLLLHAAYGGKSCAAGANHDGVAVNSCGEAAIHANATRLLYALIKTFFGHFSTHLPQPVHLL